jgi:hypothetical protein
VKEISDPDLSLCVGITAHRDLVADEIPGIERLVRIFFQGLDRDFPDLPLQLLTPLAEGGDQLAARVALSLDIPLIAVLPMEQLDYERDFTSEAALAEFRKLLSSAIQVITLPRARADEYSSSPGGSQAERERQYAQVGVFVSNHCQVLLTLWDGKTSKELGGTGQVVHYHLTAVMEGFRADPSSASLLADNENDLVHHIVCSRNRADGDPEPGLEVMDVAWFSSRLEGARTKAMPDAYHVMLSRLQEFSRDWRQKKAIINARSSSLLDVTAGLEIPPGARGTDRFFRAADGLAVHYQGRVNSSLRATHALAILMGLVFLIYSEYESSKYMVLGFLALFFSGVAMHIIGESREWHRKYLDYRALAEGLRVQLYWNLAGVVDSESVGFAYDNFLQKQDVDLGWIRHVMRQASMRRDRGSSPDPGWVSWVIENWIGDPSSGSGQLAYYSSKQLHNTSRFRRTRMLGSLCLWAGIFIAVMLFLLDSGAVEEQRHILLILMGVLPLVAGIWDAYSHKKAEKELIKQYGFMSGVFSKARKLLDESDDLVFQRRVLKALGQAALDEGAEWLLMHRERPLEHGHL